MSSKLKLSIIVFFIFIIAFIAFVLVSENSNMEQLKTDYPELDENVYLYRKDAMSVWAIKTILAFAIPLFFLISKLSQKISISAGDGRNLFLSGLLYGFAFFGIVFLINLPFDYYSSYVLMHKYGLTDQSFIRWLELMIKGFVINDLIMCLFLWIPYYLMYRSPNTWWLQVGVLLIPVIIFMVFISPFIIDPIFNNYTSIEEGSLGQKINILLEDAKVEDAEIFMVDKSRDTKTMNAYMTGIYKSKRIVLWDTTVNNLSEDEVLSITAHEIGHYVKGHIWKNILSSTLASIIILYLVFISSNWILKSSYGAFGFKNMYNYASIPLLILTLNIFVFLSNPISNYISRNMEIEADSYEISLTQDRESAVSAMKKLYDTNLGIPRPSKIYELWYYTHPPLDERIKFYMESDFEPLTR